MPTAAEAAGNQSEIQATLDQGVEQISARQQVQFQRYQKFVLDQDGYVFWVATAETMTVDGSLHYVTDRLQDEDQTIGANQVLLTSESEITQFNLVSPLSMWIANWPITGGFLQVAFAQRGSYYQEANIWHYSGFAVYPALKTQIISNAADLPAGPIVSNSLPIWLSLNSFAPVYPSFLVPDNIVPPYIVAHIEPSQTESLAAMPLIAPWPGVTIPNSGASPLHQIAGSILARDHVTLTLYGFSNQTALQYLQYLIETSVNFELFGFANSPVPRDAKRVQVEIASLAQKKTIDILANYYQGTADMIARRLFLSAGIGTLILHGGVAPIGQGTAFQAEATVSGAGA